MDLDAAAVFAQVLPVLFIANYLTRKPRLRTVNNFTVGSTVAAEFILLLYIAVQMPVPLPFMVFVWAAIGSQLVLVVTNVFLDSVTADERVCDCKD